jgi:uncharacterized protein (DUF1800 family)
MPNDSVAASQPAVSAAPPEDPFSPFVPDNSRPWDLHRVNHLLRRLGFGPSYDRMEKLLAMAPAAAIDSLLNYDPAVDPFAGVIEQMEGLFNLQSSEDVARWWIYRMIYSPNPAQEKLALFWHNHFATSGAKVGNGQYMHRQIELFRAKGIGSFRELLIEVAEDPAMLIWLDGRTNRKGKPNENFAREVMELFTLGVGNYTEADIKQLARAFTGWQIADQQSRFEPKLFDDGEKEVFGVKGSFDTASAISLILRQPAAPRFLARRLLRGYVHPEPTDEHVNYYAARLLKADWNIKTVLSEMTASRLFFYDWANRSKIKSPAELVIGSVLVLGGKVNTQFVREEMAKMGQSLLFPPNVKGWDGEQTWINSNTVLGRFNVGMELSTQRRENEFARRSDLDAWMKKFGAQRAADVIQAYARMMLDGDLDQSARADLIEFMNRNEKNEPVLFSPTPEMVNTKVRGMLHLMMSMPEYQLA